MKRVLLLIFLCAWGAAVYADSLLSGTPIGSSSSGWIGLDLGAPHVVTILGLAPSETGEGVNSTMLGVFEGANRPDFMDALPLYIVTEQLAAGQIHYMRTNCSRGFRYIRYTGAPDTWSVRAEIEVWGDAGAGDDSHLTQLTNLPTITIHTKNDQLPYDKEHEIECFISIISQDGQTLLADTATIRERGNYSRNFPKKPYRIKFAHKHNVLGAPANARKWTLINNYGDKTLMRNQLAFELSRRFGMPYTPFCAYVDVLLNGEYKGCYQLCDQVEVRKNRVEITEMTPRDNSGDALTGGYFIEVDAYADQEPSMFWSDQGTPVTIKSPDEDSITWQQSNYICRHYNKMESNWRKYLDLNTFLRHFLVGEVSGNTDTYWSVFLYKQRSNDTLYVGPCWDFDIAFDNDDRTYHVCDKSDYIYRSGGSTVGYMRTLADKIVKNDSVSKMQLELLWNRIRRSGFTEESFIRYIDEQEEMLQESQRLNFIRWPIMSQRVHQNPRIHGSYAKEVENVRRFMRNRIVWMDNMLHFDPSLYESLTEPEETAPQAEKVLVNGQVLIRRNGIVYTPAGQVVSRY